MYPIMVECDGGTVYGLCRDDSATFWCLPEHMRSRDLAHSLGNVSRAACVASASAGCDLASPIADCGARPMRSAMAYAMESMDLMAAAVAAGCGSPVAVARAHDVVQQIYGHAARAMGMAPAAGGRGCASMAVLSRCVAGMVPVVRESTGPAGGEEGEEEEGGTTRLGADHPVFDMFRMEI